MRGAADRRPRPLSSTKSCSRASAASASPPSSAPPGIVYGDIGTSPLYALETALSAAGTFDAAAVLGVLSLIFWSLAISVTLKYIVIIMRADNEGEGGILALFALAQRRLIIGSRWAKVAVGLALAGTAFFFCDALITPAISVLGAVEGLEVLNPGLQRAGWCRSRSAVIAVLFAYQHRGTARVAQLFGPDHGGLVHRDRRARAHPARAQPAGARRAQSARRPGAACAASAAWRSRSSARCSSPSPAARRCTRTWGTSASARCASPGSRWWRRRWSSTTSARARCCSSLATRSSIRCITLVPPQLLPWMVMLATAAAVIASQATISGAFSMARQAVHLDLLPRLRVLQTSAQEQGQIYVPIVNWLVFPAVVLFVVGFGSSDALGGAYGAAVVGTMVVTTILGAFVAATQWNWPMWRVGGLFGLLLVTDCAFVAGNLTKVPNGGWIPLAAGRGAVPDIHDLAQRAPRTARGARQDGGAAQRARQAGGRRAPRAGHRRVPGEQREPRALGADPQHRAQRRRAPARHHPQRRDRRHAAPGSGAAAAHRGAGAGRALHHRALRLHGDPGRGRGLKACRARGLRVFTEDSSFFVGRHVVRARPLPGLRGLQRRLFARMQQYSTQAAEFFRMPFRDVVILNTAVEI